MHGEFGLPELLAAASDLSLVVTGDGVIEAAFAAEEDLRRESEAWVGKRWVETVTVESRPKVEQLLSEALAAGTPQRREINQLSSRSGECAVRFAVFRGEAGKLYALGQDLRAVARVQQRLVDAQRAMERDYLRLRSAETRYRLLFQLSTEAVLILDATNNRVIDLNPAAAALLESTAGRVVGRPFVDLFDAPERELVQGILLGARAAGRLESVRAHLASGRRAVLVAGVAYRQDEATQALVRLTPLDASAATATDAPPMAAEAFAALPDGLVVTDEDRIIRSVNRAFLEMTELTRAEQILGEALDARLGRSGVEASVLFGNLREHGTLRDFATTLRGDLGALEDVEITAAAVAGDEPGFVFLVRRGGPRGGSSISASELPRTADELTDLIGRLPLKDIVRETADVIERLCIEEALRLTGDNRAAAAQMLGLSRQSLYDKLRRYGIGDLGSLSDAD